VSKRLISTLIASLGISSPATAQQHFTLSNAEVTAPPGWQQVTKTADRLVLRTSDRREQAVISVLRLGADANLEDFTRLCQLRIDAERQN
jgi:hypothetical protein